MTTDAPAGLDFWGVLSTILERFPQYAPLLQKPGVFAVLAQGINEKWAEPRLFAALQNTEYFKTTTDTQRGFDWLAATNPSTARETVAKAGDIAARVGMQLGIPLDQAQLMWLGVAAANGGWDEARIRAQIVANTNGASQIGPGSIADKLHQNMGLAAQYAVPVDANTAYWWAANTLGGSTTDEGYRSYLQQQAMNLYPALAQPLSEGQSVAQYAAPYMQLAANELGVNPNSIDLSQPKWMDVLLGTDAKGVQGVNSMTEALAKVRSDPTYGYDKGTPGITQASQFAQQLGQLMGAIG